MDSLRGKFGFSDGADEDAAWDDAGDDSDYAVDDTPPAPVGQDERRMQVRAYNYWASLLGERNYPSVEDIEPDGLPDFAENGVLLDFTAGIENPAIAFLGEKLAGECGAEGPIRTLADVPGRSLLSRVTDHYMQILANEAPIGFEAEFINDREMTILYRGILLPFSTDDESIDFIYGVINWKEVADQLTTDELLLEVDQALDPKARERREEDDEDSLPPERRPAVFSPSITRWADGPGSQDAQDASEETREQSLPRPSFARLDAHLGDMPSPEPEFGDPEHDPEDAFDPLADLHRAEAPSGLHDCLADARALAAAAHSAELRSRSALYRAVGRAYDVSLAAQDEPESFAALLEENGIAASPRAPMTPVVKLVFGTDYDKTRLAEYAAALSYARREKIAAGELSEFLETAEGGLKAVVARERALRRSGKSGEADGAGTRLQRRLGKLPSRPLSEIPATGAEFSLCVIRRDENGQIAFLGEVADDERLLARAARHLAD
ncbi:MAG: hypothetical protein CL808_06985 [Citromicrobium sp.]|nr:hypothetical protein [Citromicrobium sp.]